MSTMYTVSAAELVDDVAYLLLDRVSGLAVGWKIKVNGVGQHYDGEHTITDVDETSLEVAYSKNHNGDIPSATVVGQLALQVTWIDSNDVLPFLGVPPAEDSDIEWLADCVDATNVWCYERRQAAGYTDLPNHVPNPRVRLGVVMKAAEEYRTRGSIDGYSSFQQLDTVQPIASNADILRMLGLNKPGIG
jgi:hypothetical protein